MTDITALKEQLNDSCQELALSLLGEPVASNAREWRWGNKGSLALAISGSYMGKWNDFESGEGGSLIDLIIREKGFGFREAVSFACQWLGVPDSGE